MKFRKTSIAAAIAFPILLSSPAFSQTNSTENRLQQSEQRIRYLEQRVQDQNAVVAEQKTALENNSGAHWFNAIEVSGAVEIEASYSDPENGDSESDIAAATVELGIAGDLNEQTSVEIVLLYEDGDSELDVDVAQLTHVFADSSFSLTAGQLYVPFGAYETGLVSDPLTLELGETRETSLLLGFEQDALSGSFYIFNGDNSEGADNAIDNWGANIGYASDAFSVGFAYINDIGDSDALQDSLVSSEVAEYTPGISANASLAFGSVTLIAEYTAATDEFSTAAFEGAKPSAANLEVDYEFALAGKAATLAAAYQVSDEALGLELPETRVLLGLGVEVNDNFGLGFEISRDEDYDVQDGGSGESSTALLLQLAAGF